MSFDLIRLAMSQGPFMIANAQECNDMINILYIDLIIHGLTTTENGADYLKEFDVEGNGLRRCSIPCL